VTIAGRRARVVYLSHAFMVGGAEEMVLNLVRHLPADKYEPMVCAIHEAGPVGREIAAADVPFRTLGCVPGLRDPLAVAAIYRYLRDTRPDIVHTFLLTASLYGRLAAIAARVPIVIGTEVNIYEHKRRHHAIAERLLMAGTDCVIASAASVKTFYVDQIRAEPSRVEVIYNAVDFGMLRATASREMIRSRITVPATALVATVIARLTEQKGHGVLFEALASTPALQSLHLVVVGDGPLRASLEAQAARAGLSPRVHFLGARRDLGDLLAASDMFVLPSLWEGLPLSLVLAMGAGLPIVSTTVAGIPEVVRDGDTGLLVAPSDAPALAGALARLVTSAGERARLGAAAREFVLPRFGVDNYVSSMTALYDRLLAKEAA
jgi:glycosyltransferase involved in cell wall biosynthesis